MSEESDFSTCRRCGSRKLRKFVGMFDHKNKKYTDELGRLWNGRVCPGCCLHKAKLRMRKKRQKDKDGRPDSNP